MNKRSPGSFCSLVVSATTGTSDSVTSLDVAALGNGAECYCVANAAVYRYNSTSTQTTVGDIFLAPLSGGGCWFRQDAESSYATFSGLAGAGVGASLASSGLWQALPTGGTFYATSGPPTSLWTLNTTTGVNTYIGPPGLKFLFQTIVSVNSGSVGLGATFLLYVSFNGALIGTSTGVDQDSVLLSIPANFQLSGSVLASLNNGDTVQPIFLVDGAAHTQAFNRYQMVITRL